MSSSQNEKKNSDVEMGEASPVLLIPAIHEATPTFVVGFLSFKERLSRRSAEKEKSRTSAETSAISSSSALSISAEGNKSLSDVSPLVGMDMVPVQVPEVLAQPWGSSTTPVPIPEKGQAMESMPPPLDRKEIVLVLPAPSAALLPKGRKRNGTATETAKKRRCSKGAEGEPSGPLPQYRTKFISLVDRMISDCGSEEGRLTEGLAESREALKRIEAMLTSTEDAHTAEVQVSGLERDLGKSASALFRMKKEKKPKASEVRSLQRQIQSQEEPRTRFGPEGIEGGLSEIQLLKGEEVSTLDSEEARLLSHKEELMASEETEGQGCAAEEGKGDAVERGDGEVAEGGDGDAVPSSDEVEDEGGAPRIERGDGEVAEGGDGDAVPSSDEVEDEGGAPRSA
ncbi:hypothetical protein F2Q68_00044330 [Brassica cretica]|uniref:Uncharacterized protein n=1 Tax=Brassica cretica TaxID=69181 RepID=A0A8S9LPI7_BRACR|nr:hypothetical protein F2Q68_00044330 [Brassica cretica]